MCHQNRGTESQHRQQSQHGQQGHQSQQGQQDQQSDDQGRTQGLTREARPRGGEHPTQEQERDDQGQFISKG